METGKCTECRLREEARLPQQHPRGQSSLECELEVGEAPWGPDLLHPQGEARKDLEWEQGLLTPGVRGGELESPGREIKETLATYPSHNEQPQFIDN